MQPVGDYGSPQHFDRLFPAYKKFSTLREGHEFRVVEKGTKLDFVPCDGTYHKNRAKEVCEFLAHYIDFIPKGKKELKFIHFVRQVGVMHNQLQHTKLKTKVPEAIMDALLLPCTYEGFIVGNNYNGALAGVLDFAYASSKKGYAVVIDPPGFGDPLKKPKYQRLAENVKGIFNEFKKEFDDLDVAQSKFEGSLRQIATDTEFTSSDRTKYAADACMTLVQIVYIQGKKHLLYAQPGNCMFVILKPDGSLIPLKPHPDVQVIEGMQNKRISGKCFIDSGDHLILFTDGIGSYITEAELRTILSFAENRTHHKLLNELHQHIIKRKETDQVEQFAINGEKLRLYTGTEGKNRDDYGLAYLIVA